MPRVHIAHVHRCSEDVFWQVFFTEDYSQRLFKERLAFPVFEQLAFEETETEIRRTVRVMPKVGDLPGPVKKVVGDSIGYDERGVFDKRRKRFAIDIIPNQAADRFSVTGVLYTEPLAERSSRRLFDANVEVRIFGIGGLLERRLIADMESSYAASAEFTNEYVAERGL
jgi:hypothetical protein